MVQESRLFGKRFPIHPKDGNTLCVYPDKAPYLRTFFGPQRPRVQAARRWLANGEVSWYKILSEEGLLLSSLKKRIEETLRRECAGEECL